MKPRFLPALLCASLTLTSCASPVIVGAPPTVTETPPPADCLTACVPPPAKFNPPRAWMDQIQQAAQDCVYLHDRCVAWVRGRHEALAPASPGREMGEGVEQLPARRGGDMGEVARLPLAGAAP